jgi:hypothetical protein
MTWFFLSPAPCFELSRSVERLSYAVAGLGGYFFFWESSVVTWPSLAFAASMLYVMWKGVALQIPLATRLAMRAGGGVLACTPAVDTGIRGTHHHKSCLGLCTLLPQGILRELGCSGWKSSARGCELVHTLRSSARLECSQV